MKSQQEIIDELERLSNVPSVSRAGLVLVSMTGPGAEFLWPGMEALDALKDLMERGAVPMGFMAIVVEPSGEFKATWEALPDLPPNTEDFLQNATGYFLRAIGWDLVPTVPGAGLLRKPVEN
jgi:hypothetical protein